MWNMDRAAVADLIAVQEGRSPVPLLDDDAVLELLRSRPRIAMIGASANPARAANGVLRNLRRAGYHVVAVNPTTTVIEDEPCYPTLADAVAATGRSTSSTCSGGRTNVSRTRTRPSPPARAACGSSWASPTSRRGGSPTKPGSRS